MSSKIKVDTIENVAGSGNVSLGSGHNLVVPGNITGSGTATITGDLTVDTSSLKVNASNNFIGIGTASPQKKVHILDTTSDGIIIFDRNGTSTDHQIVFAHNYQSGGQSGGNYYGIGVDGSENKLVFAYDANSQASLSADAKMLMDASGRVTIPNQPSFRAGMTANQTVAQNAVVTYQTTDHNIGNHFDTSSNVGRFTAPVAGRYLFGIAMGDGNNSGIAGIFALCKNGSRYYDFLEGGAPSGISGHYEKHASVVVNASANDYFDIRQISSGNKNLEGTSDGLSTRNRFWGHLLG